MRATAMTFSIHATFYREWDELKHMRATAMTFSAAMLRFIERVG
jgi:hypothetical protein